MRPIVFIDVDDVINVLAPTRRDSGLDDWKTRKVLLTENGVRAKFKIVWSPTITTRIANLDADLRWATSWGLHANRHLTGLFGWPTLPVVAGPTDDSDTSWTSDDPRKTAAVIAAADRPFVWIDDAIDDDARAAVSASVTVPYLLIAPDPAVGLTSDDLDRVDAFLTAHRL